MAEFYETSTKYRNYNRALKYYDLSLKYSPYDVSVIYKKCLLLQKMKKYNKSLKLLQDTIETINIGIPAIIDSFIKEIEKLNNVNLPICMNVGF